MFSNEDVAEIILRSGEHLILVTIAMIVAIAIGIPLGIAITRYPKFAQPILGVANALQTIPSLAIFGFLISVPFLGGIGKNPAIVALTLYALLPLIRNTYVGINSVDRAIREAGRGMGMTDWQLLTQVEIPLASGAILAGIRVATAISVGVATIAAAIGGGGLGVFIFRGLATLDNRLILMGAVPAAAIALGADLALGWIERRLREQPLRRGKLDRKYAIGGGILALLIAGLVGINYFQAPPTIAIGSKNFTEQVILGELLAQQIEMHTNINVDRQLNLGGAFICHEAVKAGKIAGYVEYTGTSLIQILKQAPIKDPQVVLDTVKQAYDRQFQLEVMSPLGFENTFAFIIRNEDAQRLQIKTLSEAAKYTPQMRGGFGYEFLERQDGYPALAKTYGLKFAKIQQMEFSLMYPAIEKKSVDLIAANSTDGLIPVLNLTILEDDKKYFPPYQAVPIFNRATLKKYPQIQPVIDKLAGKISTQDIQQMNYQVDNKSRPVDRVVREWLKSKNLT
ncbi:glycine betaine ABC transporter substrate-binding protein [Chamaesiphon minutus]|uniref:Periplasmic glycine betaine/choline-binding (Lipo)protein of an ABC-type transport system (Osmoprotectant binding protein) n=1 Tax=Chamaesiphon minutus (strain ATCC 27169 / PCC 6605) TaxID=1173020 RepID=K9UHW1_CHAP6|nr:glycine betaine ABC transporter substrate-binding protein [Chamaesiphon minutus]AFY94390.1 periplasmic glycine betaine/choline-binding (lipo)protein of an ABC-type transport system (osmoprotectant binding protein) [Chamaesiphon minutus PCC 6605]